jgi:hypothetical protein
VCCHLFEERCTKMNNYRSSTFLLEIEDIFKNFKNIFCIFFGSIRIINVNFYVLIHIRIRKCLDVRRRRPWRETKVNETVDKIKMIFNSTTVDLIFGLADDQLHSIAMVQWFYTFVTSSHIIDGGTL